MTRWRQIPLIDEPNTEERMRATRDDWDKAAERIASVEMAVERVRTATYARVHDGEWNAAIDAVHHAEMRRVCNVLDNLAALLATTGRAPVIVEDCEVIERGEP